MRKPAPIELITLILVLAAGAPLAVHGATAKPLPATALSAGGAPPQGTRQRQSAPKPAQATGRGPLLTSTQIAPFTYEIYPKVATQANLAESGFQVSVTHAGSGKQQLSVQSTLPGGPSLKQDFRASDRAYWIETSFGDDGPGQDANVGDDAVVLTDAQGYITQR